MSTESQAIRYHMTGQLPDNPGVSEEEQACHVAGLRAMASAMSTNASQSERDRSYSEAYDAVRGRRSIRGPFN